MYCNTKSDISFVACKHQDAIVIVFTILLLTLMLVITGCGGGGDKGVQASMLVGNDSRNEACSGNVSHIAELEAELAKALSELGITDPAKVPAAAPSGEDTAVFDLQASLIDPDGTGGEPPTGVTLTWTERMIGDYDANGEVSSPDLIPISQHWEEHVGYADPALHGGLEWWPTGDPDDGAAGTENWVKARVDGDANTEIRSSDVAKIAQHWHETLGGYCVYRKNPDAEGYTLIETVSKPEGSHLTVPVRYSYHDEPPVAGTYSYYVVAYGERETQEADTHSNEATVLIEYGFADTLPPAWDGVEGAASAQANADGTVTVTWGTATDVAPLGVEPSPPVHYTVYWSTQTPVDYVGAAFANDVSSPWVSPQLLDNQTYYFSVRVRDSAEPSNEDENTVEAEVQVTGGVAVDTEPPVWLPISSPVPGQEDKVIEGLAEVYAYDGYLRLRRGRAMDVLSPPVKYNLYYMSTRYAPFLTDGDELMDGYQTLESMPEWLDFTWENRHAVRMLAAALDSAPTPNRTSVYAAEQWTLAPTDLRRVEIDTSFPGAADDMTVPTYTCFDPAGKTLYILYGTEISPDSKVYALYCLVMDCRTGEWEPELIGYSPEADMGCRVGQVKLNYRGELWVQFVFTHGIFSYSLATYWRNPTGQWTKFETEIPGEWFYCFDHNGYPTSVTLENSDLYPGERMKALYNYYDPEANEYLQEVVADPGSNFDIHSRPDGTLALVMRTDRVQSGADEESPALAGPRVFERDIAGNWTLALQTEGRLSLNYNGFTEYWDEDWKWVNSLSREDGNFVITETNSGFSVHGPFPDYVYGDGDVFSIDGDYYPSKNNGGYDLLPGGLSKGVSYTFGMVWNGTSYTLMRYNTDYSAYVSLFRNEGVPRYADRTYYNRADGFMFSLISHPSLDGARHALFAYIGDEGSLFELNP